MACIEQDKAKIDSTVAACVLMSQKGSPLTRNGARAEASAHAMPVVLKTRARALGKSCSPAPRQDMTAHETDMEEMRIQLLWDLSVTNKPEDRIELPLQPQRPSEAREGVPSSVLERALGHTIVATLEWSPGQTFAHRISARVDTPNADTSPA